MINILTFISNIFKNMKIEFKIYGIVICVVVLITSFSMVMTHISVTQSITNQLEDRAVSISIDLASRSIDPLLTNNILVLQNLIDDTIYNYRDISYIFIMKNNNIIAHSGGEKTISRELVLNNNINNNNNKLSSNAKNIYTEEGKVIDIATPILLDLGGVVRVGLTYDSLYRTLAKINSQMLYAMLGILLLSVLIVYRLTKKLTTPISELVMLTDKISNGILSDRIGYYSNDEIGGLSKSFNHMLDELEGNEKEKEKYIEKIKNRNKELLLLNVISQNFTSIDQLKNILHVFVEKLAKAMKLECVLLRVRILDNWEVVKNSRSDFIYINDELNTSVFDNKYEDNNDKDIKKYVFHLKSKTDELFGEITICSKKEIDSSFLNSLELLKNQLAISVENFELWNMLKIKEEARQMLLEKIINSQEEERKRIARELHDETSHLLSSILVELKILSETKKNDQHITIDRIRNLVQATIDEVHELGWQLRPSILDKFGLKVAIERYITEYKKSNNIELEFIINGIILDMTPELETTIYRLIQEALTNISKHAEANNISVIITSTKKYISIVIEDDGKGFDSHKRYYQEPLREHLGLLGMHERVSLFGGEFDIESKIMEGTIVIAKIPYQGR